MSIHVQYNVSCDWCGVTCEYGGGTAYGAVQAASAVNWRVDPVSHVCKKCADKNVPDKKADES